MNAKIKQYSYVYASILTIAAICFGIPMLGKLGVVKGIMATGVYALLLTTILVAIFVPIDLIRKKNYPEKAFNLEQQLCLKIPISCEESIKSCEAILWHYARTSRVEVGQFEKVIQARTKVSLLTFGEQISIRCDAISSQDTMLFIESKPAYKLAFLDYGRNYQNILYIKKKLEDVINSKGIGRVVEV